MTKSLKIKRNVLTALSFLLTFGPMIFFLIAAFISDTAIKSKIGLGCTLLIVIILTLVAVVNKIALRSRLWIMLIGFWLCLDYIIFPLVTIAICQTLDELIVTPLKEHYKSRYSINKEIDRRL